MNSLARMLLGAALVTAGSTAASAQNDAWSDDASNKDQQKHATTQTGKSSYVFADDLMNAELTFAGGQETAQVTDAVIMDGKIKFLVVSTTDGDFVVPWKAMKLDTATKASKDDEENAWRLQMTSSELTQKGVRFDGDWSRFQNESWVNQLEASASRTGNAIGQAAEETGDAVGRAADETEDALDPNDEARDEMNVEDRNERYGNTGDAGDRSGYRTDRSGDQASAGKQMKEMRASQILGSDVENREGEDLGALEKLVIDTSDGEIKYGAVDVGGFLGMGESRVLVPWQAFTWVSDEGDAELMVNATEETLERFAYDDEEFPSESEIENARHLPVEGGGQR